MQSHVTETVDKEAERKKYKCRVCGKTHARWKCQHACEFCGKTGHRAESCWNKHPKLAPSGVAGHLQAPQGLPLPPAAGRDRREPTPGPRSGRSRQRRSSGRKSDRGSSFERSASEPESPAPKGPRKRHRSNRVIIHLPPGTEQSTSTGVAESSLFGSAHHSWLKLKTNCSQRAQHPGSTESSSSPIQLA